MYIYKSIISPFLYAVMYENSHKRVKQSHYRTGVAQRVPGSYGSQIS